MGGTVKWIVDDQFKKIVTKAVQHKLTPMLAKDQGVYICLHAPKGKTGKAIVAYGKGLDPSKDKFDDWYPRAHAVCGGDDFVEELPLEFLQKIVDQGREEFHIRFSQGHMDLQGIGGHKADEAFVKSFQEWFSGIPDISLAFLVRQADQYENETDPPKGWDTPTPTPALRKKMIAWLKAEFADADDAENLHKDYKKAAAAMRRRAGVR